jgi:hypothetical protein
MLAKKDGCARDDDKSHGTCDIKEILIGISENLMHNFQHHIQILSISNLKPINFKWRVSGDGM